LLRKCLKAYALLAAIFAVDDNVTEFTNTALSALFNDEKIDEDKRTDVIERVRLVSPFIASTVNMSVLNSARLANVLDGVMKDPAVVADPGQALMGALLAQAIGRPGWSAHLVAVFQAPSRWPWLRQTVEWAAAVAYSNHGTDNREISNLVNL